MSDFYEIDFWDVESDKSGDAISLRYELNGQTFIHVIDAGFQATGESLVANIRKYYGSPKLIHHVVATHNDGDHAGGLRAILESFEIGSLWMLRPWVYADELIHRFETYESVEHLRRKLRSLYPNLAVLEDIALERGITIREPFQGQQIGAFTVMAPSRSRYLDLIVASEKTPEAVDTEGGAKQGFKAFLEAAKKAVKELIKALWGQEAFSPLETSAENEMSIVQYARLCEDRLLLTGDTGRGGLAEAAAFAPAVGLALPGIDKFQVPHHGSRRNVNTELLDHWLGPRVQEGSTEQRFSAYISSAKADEHHPRKAVVRAMHHRAGSVHATEGQSIRTQKNAPDRGWSPAPQMPYPTEQEKD